MSSVLRVSGRPQDAAQASIPLVCSPLHHATDIRAVNVASERDAGARIVEVPATDDTDLVELQLEGGGAIVTGVDRLRVLMREGARLRGDDETVVGPTLPFATPDRGIGAVALAALRVFRADPVDAALATLATREAIERIEAQLSAPPGLYQLDDRGGLAVPVAAPVGGDGAVLVFLHGTASSTSGSFGQLFAGTSEWRDLRRQYGTRIYALEHRTLSESPAHNALAAVRLLTPGAEVHLVSHSRGGLVGELLCRGGFGAPALVAFERRAGRPPGERNLLLELGAELEARRLRVERFVRVACPAAGTLLASNRLDLYLSLVRNALVLAAPTGVDAAVDRVGALLLEIARRRAEPHELPGLEAQRPESPFVHFLNRADQAPVDHDLTVIAGDLRSGNLGQALQTIAAYTFFLQKNDLVVDTRAMYGGVPRTMASGGWVSFHEGPGVSHFTYFSEAPSRRALASALLRERKDAPPPGAGFVALRVDRVSRSFAFYRDAADADARPERHAAGRLFVVPDIFASELAGADGRRLWPDAAAIAGGRLYELGLDRPAPDVGGLVAGAGRLSALDRLLSASCDIVPVAYDWRLGVAAAADSLKGALDASLDGTGPIGIVAHGLGALAVLDIARRNSPEWREFRALGGRAVLLAPPVDGADFLLRLAAGTGPLFRMLETIDGVGAASDLVKWVVSLPGVADLLPGQALDQAWWQRYGGDAPGAAVLSEARGRRAELQLALEDPALSFVFGAADATVAVTLSADGDLAATMSRDGDGWMVFPRGSTPASRTWFVPVVHEALLSDPRAARVAADLVLRGNTAAGEHQPPEAPARRKEMEPLRFPGQEDLEAALLFGGEPPPPVARVLRVRAAHGSLDRRRTPVAVGHYNGDMIAGAEAFLDRAIGGALSRRLALGPGRYPGPVGSARYEPAPDRMPPGALVVGLGDVGDLTASHLTRGARAGVLEYALHEINRHPEILSDSDPRARLTLPLASLLIGTRGGRQLSVRRSVSAVVNGVLQANRELDEKFRGKVAVGELWFVELWADVATQAGQAVEGLDDDITIDLRPDEAIEARGQLVPLEGARGNSRETTDWTWWERIIVSGEPQGGHGPAALRFTSLTERARAEDRIVFTGALSLDDLLGQATRPAGAVGEHTIANALYGMLLPPAVKDALYDSAELVLVVDGISGQYPWELLARMRDGELEPLIARISIIRQFRSVDFRETLLPARTTNALVIGNPAGVEPQLKGAQAECDELTGILEQRAYSVTLSNNEDAGTILQKFFLGDYRIVHIAAHGEYCANDPARTGVVIGPSTDGHLRVLTAETFRQLPTVPDLVFLNCCHLGRLDLGPSSARRIGEAGRLAASVAETLIKIGIRCVVVAGWAVNDVAARTFSNTFYARFLDGECFGDAVHAARQAVWREFGDTTTWGAYQCYGDPIFTIAERHGHDGVSGARPFVSSSEAREELEDIVAAASTSGEDAGRLRPRLEAIECRLEHDWRFDGALLYARARAHAALGNTSEAIALYHESLYANEANAPVKAAEQCGNLLARLADDVAAEAAGGTPGPRSAAAEALLGRLAVTSGAPTDAGTPVAERTLALAKTWLSRVAGLGATPERFGLEGGRLRRAAMARPAGSTRRHLLHESAQAYAEGVRLGIRRTGRVPYFPAIPAVAGAWAAGRLSRGQKAELVTWLNGARLSAQLEEEERGRTAWTAVTPLDADLLDALLAGDTTPARAREFGVRYRDCLARYGTSNERASMRAQLDFLTRVLEDRHETAGGAGGRARTGAASGLAFLRAIREQIGDA